MRRGLSAAVAAVLLLSAGCGTVQGSAQPGLGSSSTTASNPTTTSGSSSVADPTGVAPSPSMLSGVTGPATSSGTAPTLEPLSELPEVDETTGRWLESRRIANQMTTPTSVDPALTWKVEPTIPVLDKQVPLVLGAAQATAVQHIGGLEAGFASSRSNGAGKRMTLLTLEFRTSELAAEAAAAVPTAPKDAKELTTTEADVSLSSRPLSEEETVVDAATSVGQLLLLASVTVPNAEAENGPDLAVDGLLALRDSMAGFRPTARELRLSLPADRDGMVAHSVSGVIAGRYGWYSAQGALHYQYDHARSADTFDRAQVDLVVVGEVSLYRAGGGAEARLVQADFLAEAASRQWTEFPVEGLPEGASCRADRGSHYCVGTYGRYVYEYTWPEAEQLARIAQIQENLLGQF